MASEVTAPAAPAFAAPFELTRKRVYILPTRHGLGFFLVVFVMLIGAVNYSNNLGHVFSFLLTSLGLIAMLHTYQNLAGLSGRITAGPPVFAGDRQTFHLRLANPHRTAKVDVCASHSDPGPGGLPRVARGDVPARGSARFELELVTRRRGLARLGRVTLATRYPLGLFRAWSYVEPAEAGLVYPRPAGSLPLPVAPSGESQSSGAPRGTDDFAGLRRYAPGDSSRRIHWKAVAREQDTAVKVFDGASPAEARLSFEAASQDGVEARLSQLCRWVLDAEAAGIRYSLHLPGQIIAAGRGADHARRCLRALALHGVADEG
jgi:uncharacterized protein (DUF58 family)